MKFEYFEPRSPNKGGETCVASDHESKKKSKTKTQEDGGAEHGITK